MAEEVLVTVRVDRPKNQDELTKLTGQIIAQKNEIKQLETAVRTLSKAEGDNNALIKSTTKNLEIKKQQLNQNVASQKALVNVINAEVGSLNSLKAQNTQLIRQRNQLNTETEEGRAGIQRINAQLDANNQKIKENSSATEKQIMNIGNYQSALAGISPGLANFTNGLQGVTVAAKTFIATPLGLILGAIALALAPVVSYLTSTGEGIDKVSRETEGFNYVLQVLKDRLNAIGKGQLDPNGAANGAASAILEANKSMLQFIKTMASPFLVPIQKVIDKYNEVAEVGRTYADTLDDLTDAEENYGIEAARTENAIKRLILESKNRTLSEEERIKKIDEALGLEAKLLLKRKTFAEDEFSAIVEYNRKRLEQVGIIQKAEETQSDFVANNIDEIRDLDEELATSLINSLKKVEEVIGDSIAIEEKLQNQRDALLDKAEEKRLKIAEDQKKDREKRAEEQRKMDEEEYEYQAEQQKTAREKEEEERIEQNRIEKEQFDNNQAYKKEKKDKELKEEQERTKKLAGIVQTFAELSSGIFLSAITGNDKLAKRLAKQLALTLIDIFSNQLAAQALADSIAKFGPVVGAIRGAVSVGLIRGAFGVAKAAINEIDIEGFATGGIVGRVRPGTPIRRSNGDDVLITAKREETIVTPMQRRIIGEENFRRAGVPGFATGGIVGSATTTAARLAESRFDANQMAGLINQVQIVLVREEFEAKQMEHNSIVNRARVI
jgi:hypothetical protein